MKFLLAIIGALLFTPCIHAQCSTIPLTYCGMTTTGSETGAAPTIGAAGTTTTDPDFSSKVLRVTDSTSCGAPAGNEGWSPNDGRGWQRSWSKDSNKVLITGTDSSSDWNYQAFTTSPLALSGSCINLYTSTSGAITYVPGFSLATSNLIYGIDVDGKTLKSCVAGASSCGTITTIKDLSTIPGFSVTTKTGSLEWDDTDTWFCAPSGVQDTSNANKIGCYNKTTTNTQVLNLTLATEQQNSGAGVALDNLSTAQLNGCVVHEINIGRDAAWLDVNVNSCTAFPGTTSYGLFWWQMGTNHVTILPPLFSSHEAMGFGSIFINVPHNQPPCATYDNRGWDMWDVTTPGGPLASQADIVEMYGCTVIADGNDFDAHVSWQNNKNDANVNAYPVIVMPFPSAIGDTNHNYYMEWEIDAIQTGPAYTNIQAAMYRTAPTATVWRIAHTFNDAWGTQCNVPYLSPNVSPNGQYIAFWSDWKGQTGSGPCTNSRRFDEFVVDASTQGSSGGSTPAAPTKLGLLLAGK
jgi:hypothetical protein